MLDVVARNLNNVEMTNKLSNYIYGLIPTFNFKPITNECEILKQRNNITKIYNAHVLYQILIAAKQSANPIEYVNRALNIKIWTNEASNIETNANTKVQVYRFERLSENLRFDNVQLPSKSCKIVNRLLLWHPVSAIDLIAIMKIGLVIFLNAEINEKAMKVLIIVQ